MQQRATVWGRMIQWIGGGAAACFLLGSCATLDKTWMPGSAASAAQNQIMLVRKNPPSFGYSRLATRSKIYPDLGFFLKKKGLPDFLAETGDHDRQYFILYYLQERKAFACRTRAGHAEALEFAGPYPITSREYRLLNGFRQGKVPK